MTQKGIQDSDKTLRQVLVVEDDAFIALDIESVMDAAGFEVVACASRVDEALALIERHKLDLVLLDFNLGGETSIPIAEALQEMNVPFMFLSGQTRDVVLADMDEDHVVMNKPFQPETLVAQAHDLTE